MYLTSPSLFTIAIKIAILIPADRVKTNRPFLRLRFRGLAERRRWTRRVS